MIRAFEAVIDEAGNVQLLEAVRLPKPRRAIVMILDEPAVSFPVTPHFSTISEPQTPHWSRFYSLVRQLGQGGMGETFLARDDQTGKFVCIKQLLADIEPRSLLQECRALARLVHPGIVRLLNFDTTGPSPYLVIEFVNGPSLAQYLRHHRAIAEPLAVCIAIKLFDALAYAHQNETIHCDLKPGNILLEYQDISVQPKILDFGLAVVDQRDGLDVLTAMGRFAGTPSYMAPEQVRGERLGGACDVYALGQVLWEMLMGRPAFPSQGRNPMSIAFEKTSRTNGLIIQDPPLDVSSRLAELVENCTLPDPLARPSSSEALGVLQALAIPDPSPAVLTPVNLGFDRPDPEGRPVGWFDSVGFVKGVSSGYDIMVEAIAQDRSCVLLGKAVAGAGEFGSLMQRCPAEHLIGRCVRLEGRLRSANLGEWAGLG